MTLCDLTRHESGIVVYGGNTVAVYNWSRCDDDQMPVLYPPDLALSQPVTPLAFETATVEHIDDIRTLIPGTVWMTDEVDEDGNEIADTDLDIVYDLNYDLLRLFCDTSLTPEDYAGSAYTLPDGCRIIAPDNWN